MSTRTRLTANGDIGPTQTIVTNELGQNEVGSPRLAPSIRRVCDLQHNGQKAPLLEFLPNDHQLGLDHPRVEQPS